MAGDWIKLEINTFDKPEVMAITVAIDFDDPDFTVGKLAKMWRWFDQHTTDGNAIGVTSALLDRYVGVTGFCAAMQSVGWLIISSDGITLPHFDFHNGKTAKQRAQGAKRAANHRVRDESNADSVTNALPREEKIYKTSCSNDEHSNDDFEQFWTAYPKKQAKQDAAKAFRSAKLKPEQLQTVLQDIKRRGSSPDWQKDGGKFIPLPATYLRGKRWEDAPLSQPMTGAVEYRNPFAGAI